MSFTLQKKIGLKKDLLKSLYSINGVVSVTLVGSFWRGKTLNNFGDIDIVLILNKINKKKYDQCINKIKSIKLKNYGLGHLYLTVNSTFGPLKFNTENNIVFHIMIYDINGHILHTIKSPFTCYDWERSPDYKGKSLKEIFPVGKIQLKDFFLSRRGINHYIENLKNNFIFYQKYQNKKNIFYLQKKKYKIDENHKLEFSYHLCKYSIINLFKFEKQKNKIPNKLEFKLMMKKIFKTNYLYYYKNYLLLEKIKKKNVTKDNNFSFNFIKNFTKYFLSFLNQFKKKEVIFLRHGRTKLNDESFLGTGRNPGILINNNIKKKIRLLVNKKDILLFSSNLKRSLQTAELINSKIRINKTNLLNEKNYGLAESLKYNDLKKEYPKIIKDWQNKKDARFPKGENDSDVLKRIKKFKKLLILKIKNKKYKKIYLVVTHNVVLRCLIGYNFNIPKFMWTNINIEHLKAINFIYFGNMLVPNLNREDFFKKLIK